jgi:lysine-N-methylase
MLTIKTLPIVENWECAGCGRCCRGSLIWLDSADLAKLREQAWEKHAEMAGVKTVVRHGWLDRRYRLAQREDGSCVFLMSDGRCRIHAEHGAEAKPLVCRMFPLQLVPLEKQAYLTTRRACPTAAADQGPELKQYRSLARELANAGQLLDQPTRPPRIIRGRAAEWEGSLVVMGSLQRLLSEGRFPLVRRIVHGLRFCSLLAECRLKHMKIGQLRELCEVLETTSLEVGDIFSQREAARPASAVLFRQIAAEYVRLHPTFAARESLRERWRFARAAVAMARGKGKLPDLHRGLPATTFEAQERTLGHLEEAVQRPFLRFFETQLASYQYAIVCRPGWSVVDSFRALALAYPVGLWLLRWMATDRTATRTDAIDVVTMLDRGQGYAPLRSAQHRARVSALAKLGDLERLVVWYAR